MLVVDGKRKNPIDFRLRGQKSRTTLALCVEHLLDTIADKVFVQSLSNFTCKLWMMREGTLLILSHGVKCKIQKNLLMCCHCCNNNRSPRWTLSNPCKPEVRPGAREELASPAWLAVPAMDARDTKGIYGGLV